MQQRIFRGKTRSVAWVAKQVWRLYKGQPHLQQSPAVKLIMTVKMSSTRTPKALRSLTVNTDTSVSHIVCRRPNILPASKLCLRGAKKRDPLRQGLGANPSAGTPRRA
jgi:hypothetical protein